jgi:hypothetical protein
MSLLMLPYLYILEILYPTVDNKLVVIKPVTKSQIAVAVTSSFKNIVTTSPTTIAVKVALAKGIEEFT